jgi:fibronectin type 3 domain-containing protein
LRAEAPGDTLLPLTPAPMTATSYEDKTVAPGVRYVYVVVAVDKASPPNRSAPSARVEETAR